MSGWISLFFINLTFAQELVELPVLPSGPDWDAMIQIGESSEAVHSLQGLAQAASIEGYTGMSLATRKLERAWVRRFAEQDQLRIRLNPIQMTEGYFIIALDRCQQGRPVLCPRLEVWKPVLSEDVEADFEMVQNFRVLRYTEGVPVQERFLGLRHGLNAALYTLDLYLRHSEHLVSLLEYLGVEVPENRILLVVPESLREVVAEQVGIEMDLSELLLYHVPSDERFIPPEQATRILRAHTILREINSFFIPEGVRCQLPTTAASILVGPVIFSDVLAGPRAEWACEGEEAHMRDASETLSHLLIERGYSLDSP